jgi:hypothetical protein
MGTVFRDDSPEGMTEVDMLTAFWDDSPEGTTKVEMGIVFWDDSPEETTTRELSILDLVVDLPMEERLRRGRILDGRER